MSACRDSVFSVKAKEFKGNKLPTLANVLSCYFFTEQEMMQTSHTSKPPGQPAVICAVTKKLFNIWSKTQLPTVALARVKYLITKHVDEYRKLQRYPAEKKGAAFLQRVDSLQKSSSKLFDICACKCDVSREPCSCRRKGNNKMTACPESDLRFLQDQRHRRKSTFDRRVEDAVDSAVVETPSLKRKSNEETEDSSIFYFGDNEEIPCKRRLVEDADFVPPKPRESRRKKLVNTAATMARYNLSPASVAAVVSSFAVDIGAVTRSNRSGVVDRSKLRRDCSRLTRDEATKAAEEAQDVCALYFDGKKGETLVKEQIGNTDHSRVTKRIENHVVILQEPGSKFLAHVTPQGSLAKDEADALINGLQERRIPVTGIKAAGCDGTSYNTGLDNGVLACIERLLGRPIQWNVCLLHGNELPLRRLLETLDGSTGGPESWKGPIGKALKSAETLPVVKFRAIKAELPAVALEKLNWELKYLLDITAAISSGECDVSLANRFPGALFHGRWVTMANRLLRLYISSKKPSATLRHLAEYVVKVYSPICFKIRHKPLATFGPQHVYELISLTRGLPRRTRDVVFKSLSINMFYAHPENILLAMLADDDQDTRSTAIRRILEARKQEKVGQIRKFVVPKLNFQAQNYTELIVWDQTPITAPPLIIDVSDEELSHCLETGERVAFPALPCHTQAVERMVREVSQKAASSVGSANREGRIHATIRARSAMP